MKTPKKVSMIGGSKYNSQRSGYDPLRESSLSNTEEFVHDPIESNEEHIIMQGTNMEDIVLKSEELITTDMNEEGLEFTNRLHPSINENQLYSTKSRFIYKGPNLVIEDIFFEKPETLIKKAKHTLDEIKR